MFAPIGSRGASGFSTSSTTSAARSTVPPLDGMDSFYRQAFDVLTSDKLAKALDVEREDPKLRDRYGIGSPRHLGDGAPMWNDQLLIARRLVEAGARCVTLGLRFLGHARRQFLLTCVSTCRCFDQGISALVEDIYARGLDRDVTVVVWGEFGRTPKINKDAGRDHWARVNSALLSGGGMKVGQVIGATDKLGASAVTPSHSLPRRSGHDLPQPGHRSARLHPRQGKPSCQHSSADFRGDPRVDLKSSRRWHISES